MAEVLGSSPSMWETGTELPAPSFSLAQPRILGIWGMNLAVDAFLSNPTSHLSSGF